MQGIIGQFAIGQFIIGQFVIGQFVIGQFAIGQFVIGQFVIAQFVITQFVIGQFNKPSTFKVVSLNQPISFKSRRILKTSVVEPRASTTDSQQKH